MKLGTSTYSFYWHFSDSNPNKLSIIDALELTANIGGSVFQICDYSDIETMDDDELNKIYQTSVDLNIEIELGTRGVDPSHIIQYINIANKLNVKFIRSMLNIVDELTTLQEAYTNLQILDPILNENNITLGLETYEKINTKDLVSLIKKLNSSFIGICLDPANTIAALENPVDVIDVSMPFLKNLHVKDVQFVRNNGLVGFQLIGTPAGDGIIDFNYLFELLKDLNKININIISELWLPFQDTIENTLKKEIEWTEKSLNYLRRNLK